MRRDQHRSSNVHPNFQDKKIKYEVSLVSGVLNFCCGKHDCSPIPVFFVFVPQNPDCYTHQKKRGRISPSMEWRYLCYLQLVSKAKNPLTPMAKEEVCPRDEIADPPGMAVLPIDIYGFDEGLVSFRTLCGVQSSLVRFAPNQAIDWGPLQWQAWLETLCLSSASS